VVCEEMTKAECQSKNGDYKGDGTTCDDVECPQGKGNGKPACGDGLVWLAALASAGALILLGMYQCLPPQAQPFAIAAVVFLFFLSTLLMFIWALVSYFNKCALDWCQAAKIWIGVLAATGVILAVLNIIFVACFFKIVWWVLAGINASWAVTATAKC